MRRAAKRAFGRIFARAGSRTASALGWLCGRFSTLRERTRRGASEERRTATRLALGSAWLAPLARGMASASAMHVSSTRSARETELWNRRTIATLRSAGHVGKLVPSRNYRAEPPVCVPRPVPCRNDSRLQPPPMRYIGAVKRACVVGSSDGIGLATARLLLGDGWRVTGVSRSESAIVHERYAHHRSDVATDQYRELLRGLSSPPFDAVIYCVGIGERLSLDDLAREMQVFEVNLLAAVATAAIVLPPMLAAGRGHLIVLSSLADVLVSDEFPSYNASKAALSSYFAGLAGALCARGVAVSHIRFGFVDTKMARARSKPFMITREAAANVVARTLRTRKRRVSFPLPMAVLVGALRWLGGLRRLVSG